MPMRNWVRKKKRIQMTIQETLRATRCQASEWRVEQVWLEFR